MKAIAAFLPESLGIFILVFFVLGLLYLSFSNIVRVTENQTYSDMATIDYVYLVEKCLKGGKAAVQEDLMKAATPESFCSMCGMCGPGKNIWAAEMDGTLIWGTPQGSRSFELLTDIEGTGGTRMARLYGEL